MKIVRIIARLNVGGPARHVIWLTEALSGEEFSSVLIAGTVPPGEEDMSYIADEAGIRPKFIPELSRELSPKDVVALIKIYRLLRREKPDIVHTHTAKAGTVGRVAALAYKLTTGRRPKIVHTFHGHVFHGYYSPLKAGLFLAIEKVLARFATDRIIVISEQQKREISGKLSNVRADKFVTIPLGIDVRSIAAGYDSSRDAIRKHIGADSEDVVVGFVGRLTEIKNLPMLLKAADLVGRTIAASARKIKFVIAGDGHLRDELEAAAAGADLSGVLTFLGNRPDIGAVYSALDIVALTSLNEGTPLSLIEGMAAERPFISTAVGGVVDLAGVETEAGDGFSVCERGLLVASNDAEAFAAGLIYLAESEKLRTRIGKSGRQFVEQGYTKSRLVSDIKALYRSLVAENGQK